MQLEPREKLLLERDVQTHLEDAKTSLIQAAENIIRVEDEDSELPRQIGAAVAYVERVMEEIEGKCR